MKPSFKTITAKIADMDTCGFFTGNGTFGLEKRDELKADIAAVEAQFDALAKVAKAAAEVQAWLDSGGSMMRIWPINQAQHDLKQALSELSAASTMTCPCCDGCGMAGADGAENCPHCEGKGTCAQDVVAEDEHFKCKKCGNTTGVRHTQPTSYTICRNCEVKQYAK